MTKTFTTAKRRREIESRVVIGRQLFGNFCVIVLDADTSEGVYPLVTYQGLNTVEAAEIGREEAIDELQHGDGFSVRPTATIEAEARVLRLLGESGFEADNSLAKRLVDAARIIDDFDDVIPF